MSVMKCCVAVQDAMEDRRHVFDVQSYGQWQEAQTQLEALYTRLEGEELHRARHLQAEDHSR